MNGLGFETALGINDKSDQFVLAEGFACASEPGTRATWLNHNYFPTCDGQTATKLFQSGK